jgi:hypothetical protein
MDQMIQMMSLRQNHLRILHHFALLAVNGALFTTILHYWQLMVHYSQPFLHYWQLMVHYSQPFCTIGSQWLTNFTQVEGYRQKILL